MKKINSQFEACSLEDWQNKLRQESEKADQVIPFAIDKGISFSFPWQQWRSSETIKVISIQGAKDQINEALSNGIETIELNIDQTLSKHELSLLFKGVIIDLIEVDFFFNEIQTAQEVIENFAAYTNQSKGKIKLKQIIKKAKPFNEFCLKRLPNHKNIGLTLDAESPQKIVEQFLNKTIAVFDTTEPGIEKHLFYNFCPSKNIIDTLSTIQSLKIVWKTLLEAYKLPFINLDLNIKVKSTLDPNTSIIDASSKALTSAISGVSSINISPFDNKGQKNIARNIHPIIRYESKIAVLDSPISGSYFIENLSQMLSENALKKLI